MFTNFPDQLDSTLGTNAMRRGRAARRAARVHAECVEAAGTGS
jgi:hypothetical protein